MTSIIIETEVNNLSIESFPNKDFCKVEVKNPMRILGNFRLDKFSPKDIFFGRDKYDIIDFVSSLIGYYSIGIEDIFSEMEILESEGELY